jgi:hypothetical protein
MSIIYNIFQSPPQHPSSLTLAALKTHKIVLNTKHAMSDEALIKKKPYKTKAHAHLMAIPK